MGRKTYDEEDKFLARSLYAAPDYTSIEAIIAKMRAEAPERYKSIQPATVVAWKKRDAGTEQDWDVARESRRLKRMQRQDALADQRAEDLLDKMLEDLLTVRDMISGIIAELKNPPKKDGEKNAGEAEDPERKATVSQLANIVYAYNSTADKILEILRGKIREVDLGRLTHESQVYFIRRVLEDIGAVVGEVDDVLAEKWKRHVSALLARLRGVYAEDVITDVSKDLCMDTIIDRYLELHGCDSRKANTHTPGVAGVAC